MDLSNFSLAELRTLQENLKLEINKREQQERAQAIEKILAIAQGVGMSVAALVGNASDAIRPKSGTVEVRYRHPSDASLRWSGLGRKPKWVKDWEESGKSLDEVRV